MTLNIVQTINYNMNCQKILINGKITATENVNIVSTADAVLTLKF